MTDIQEGLGEIGSGFKKVFMAGIGALAITGEKGKQLVDVLVEKGEMTIDQGKEINQELGHKAEDVARDVRDGAVEARMKMMSREEREAFAAKVAEFAAAQNAEDEKRKAARAAESAAGDAASAVSAVACDVSVTVEDVASTVQDAVEDAASVTVDVVQDAADAAKDAASKE